MSVEVAIDADNDNEFDAPGRTAAERAADLSGSGKLAIVGTGDSDEDYIPDYADGTTRWPGAEFASSGAALIPVVIDLSKFPLSIDSEICVDYAGCDPAEMTRTEVAPGRFTYSIGSNGGNSRLWTYDGPYRYFQSVKDGGEYIAPGCYTPAELGLEGGGTVTWYLEILRPGGGVSVMATKCAIDGATSCSDTGRYQGYELHVDDGRAWRPGMSSVSDRNAAMPMLMDVVELRNPAVSQPVQGAITDGTSVCVVRLSTTSVVPGDKIRVSHQGSGYGGSAAVLGGFAESTAVLPKLPFTGSDPEVATERNLDDGLAIYIPPDEFSDPRYRGDGQAWLSEGSTAMLRFEIIRAGKVIGVFTDFRLRRPPLVLVHGLWSSPTAWDLEVWKEDGWVAPGPRGIPTRIHKVDYSSTHEDGYDVNWSKVASGIEDALADYRSGTDGSSHLPSQGFFGLRYAATRVDVVGHSMGGVLTRLYISNVECGPTPRAGGDATTPPIQIVRGDSGSHGRWHYLRPDNYGAGSIRRFISLGSPFDGSSLAATVRRSRSVTRSAEAAKEVVRSTRRGTEPDPRNMTTAPVKEALFDLEPGSTMQLLTDQAQYPTAHKRVLWKPMVGVANSSVDPTTLRRLQWFGLSQAVRVLPDLEELDPLRGDLVVLKESQANGQLPPQAPLVATIWTETVHSNSPELTITGLIGEPNRREIREFVERILYQDNRPVWQGDLR